MSGINRPLTPIWASTFRQVTSRLANRYLEEPSLENLFLILALPKGGLSMCLKQAANGNKDARKIFNQYPHDQFEWEAMEFHQRPLSDSQRVQRYITQGRLSSASRALGNTSKVLPLTDNVLDTLRAKHPTGANNPFRLNGDLPGLMPSTDLPQILLRKMKPDTAAGISGWNYNLMDLAFRDEPFRNFFNLLTKQVVSNTAPAQEMLCASKLTPLAKSDGGVRPIAVGEMFYRLIMKVIMKTYYNPSSLLPFQFGVGTPGGVEPIICYIESAIHSNTSPFDHVISLDFKNAFNCLPRTVLAGAIRQHSRSLYRPCKWAYGKTTPLVIANGDAVYTIDSSEGVRQGDPLGPLLFSLGIRQTLSLLQDFLGERGQVLAYLDDVFVVTKGDLLGDIKEFLRYLKGEFELNGNKCSSVHLDIIKRNGLELLGTVVGGREARTAFLRSKISGVSHKLNQLSSLPSQHALLLLTRCIQQDLRHLQRSLFTSDCNEEWTQLDLSLWNVVHQLRGSPRELPTDATLYSLPTSMGGLGIYSYKEVSPIAHQSMVALASRTLKPLLYWNQNEPIFIASVTAQQPFHFLSDVESTTLPLPQRQRCQQIHNDKFQQLLKDLEAPFQNMLIDNGSKIGRKWLTTIPFNKALTLSDADVAVALHYRTLCPGSSNMCQYCGHINSPAHDDVCNSRPNRRLARHEYVKSLLIRYIRASGSSVTPEPTVKNGKLRTDFRVAGTAATNGGTTEYDLAIISPLYQPSYVPIVPERPSPSSNFAAILNTMEREKQGKYQHRTHSPFVPLVLSLGGTVGPLLEQTFKTWRPLIPQFDLLIRLISIGLIRARSTNFNF